MKRALVLLALVACKKSAPPAPPPSPVDGVDLPVLAVTALPAVTARSPLLVATRASLVFDGAQVITLTNGVVDPAYKDGGALGIKIPKIAAALNARRIAGEPHPPLQLALDRALTYKLMIEIMFSAKQREAGWKEFTLLAKHGKTVVGFPITLPDVGRVSAGLGAQIDELRDGKPSPPPPEPQPQSLGLFVSVTKTELLVWSTSGTEGSLREPRARLAPAATAELATLLAEIAKRYPGETSIVFQADAATSMQQVAELLAAIMPTFPDVMFSSGFE